jgi:predicted dithiol-disulfide oxidoreductase (DUF899 family)
MNDQIKQLQLEVFEAKQKLREAIGSAAPEPVEDWELMRLDGTAVKISELFGDHTELLVIHNMGRGCHYCSLWGDAMIGIADHLQQRCGFVLCSNDEPESIAEFREVRGWSYPCVSGAGSGFAKAMGYMEDGGRALPGVSAFHRNEDGTIVRTGDSPFGPGDDFCGVWPMLDMIQGGKGEWEPTHGRVDLFCSGDENSPCRCS